MSCSAKELSVNRVVCCLESVVTTNFLIALRLIPIPELFVENTGPTYL